MTARTLVLGFISMAAFTGAGGARDAPWLTLEQVAKAKEHAGEKKVDVEFGE
ncbi:MAG: hypothetical protein Q8N26_02480 [Myxococcales bacterium]|nr:hypothetical protein [Myxococcales bacterium]